MNVTQMEIHRAENGYVITYVDMHMPGMGTQRLHLSRDIDTLAFDVRNLFTSEPTPVPAFLDVMRRGVWQQPEQVSSLPAEVAPAPATKKKRYVRRDE